MNAANPFEWLPEPGQVRPVPGGVLWCERWDAQHDDGEVTGKIVFRFHCAIGEYRGPGARQLPAGVPTLPPPSSEAKLLCLAAVPALVAGMDVMTLGISLWLVSVGIAVLLGCLLGRRMHSTGLPSRNGLLSQQEMLRRPVYWQEVMDAEIQRLKAPYDETRPENTDETVAWWR
jgi:hypothetical protein